MNSISSKLRSQLSATLNSNQLKPLWCKAKIAFYRGQIALNKGNYRAYYLLGQTLTCQDRLSTAVAAYERAIELNPTQAAPYFYLGKARFEQQKFIIARENLEKAISLNISTEITTYPNAANVYYYLGRSLYELGQLDKAIAAYQKLISLDPQYSWCHYHLGVARATQQQWQAAAEAFTNQLEQKPEHYYSYDLLAQALDKLSDEGSVTIADHISTFTRLSHQLVSATNPQFKPSSLSSVKQPNFIIIGQHKCGTTSLYSYLRQHPQILPSIKKEIHFWNHNFERGLDWYHSHFPTISPTQSFITGEASTTYLDYPEIAPQIAALNPQVKLIILLRNPVDRALSSYYMYCKIFGETRTIDEAIFSPLNNYRAKDSDYLLSSQYIDLIRSWGQIFPQEQFLILKSEDLFEYPEQTVDRVFEFLQVFPYQLNEYQNKNPGFYSDISDAQRQLLQDYFRPYNLQLEFYLERQFNWY